MVRHDSLLSKPGQIPQYGSLENWKILCQTPQLKTPPRNPRRIFRLQIQTPQQVRPPQYSQVSLIVEGHPLPPDQAEHGK